MTLSSVVSAYTTLCMYSVCILVCTVYVYSYVQCTHTRMYSVRVFIRAGSIISCWMLQVVDPEFGYMEPLIATSGRIPLRLAVEMINSHKDDPETSSAKNLADKYSLDLETTYLILEYFQPFNLKLPKAESLVGKPHALLKDRKLKQAQKLIAEAEQTMNKSKPS